MHNSHRYSCVFRLVITALIAMTAMGTVTAQAPTPKEADSRQGFNNAVSRLNINPRDHYLQYVVLQLGIREGRQQEAENIVDNMSIHYCPVISRTGFSG